MISRENFLKQDSGFRQSLIPSGIKTVVVEAGVRSGWEGIATSDKDMLTIDTFGLSAPASDVKEYFGLTVKNLLKIIG